MTSAAGQIAVLASSMVEAAVAALSSALGVTVAASPPRLPDRIDTAAMAHSVVARSTIVGTGSPGGLITALPGTGLVVDGETAVGPDALFDVLASGAAEAMSSACRAALQARTAERLAQIPAVTGLGEHLIEFVVEAGDADPMTIRWILDSDLVEIVTGTYDDTPGGVAPAAFPEMSGRRIETDGKDLSILSAVPTTVTVEFGRTVMLLPEILALAPGRIVELDRPSGAPVDVLVNGSIVARGEILVMDDQLGVRLTTIAGRRR